MTKRIVSFGAILAILALPLAVHAQPTRGTAGADAARAASLRCRQCVASEVLRIGLGHLEDGEDLSFGLACPSRSESDRLSPWRAFEVKAARSGRGQHVQLYFAIDEPEVAISPAEPSGLGRSAFGNRVDDILAAALWAGPVRLMPISELSHIHVIFRGFARGGVPPLGLIREALSGDRFGKRKCVAG